MSYGSSIEFLLNQMRNAAGTLGSGSVTFYAPGTTTKKAIYLDRDMATPAANPYTLTSDGTAELFATGVYRVVFKNSSGVTVYDYDDVSFANDAASSVNLYSYSDSPVDIAGKSYITIIKSDATVNLLNIIDSTVGATILGIAGATGINLTVQNECISLVLPSGTSDWKRIA